MSISVNSVSPATNNIISYKESQKNEKHSTVDAKTATAASLAIIGITTMAILALKSKKKPKVKPEGKKPDGKPKSMEANEKKKSDNISKPKETELPKPSLNKKVADMTEEEKLAYIKEVQALTDDPAAKAQYAEYIQNGTWDLLNS